METVIKLTRENLKRELDILQSSLWNQFEKKSLMRLLDRGETRHRMAGTFLEKVGARATKAGHLGKLLGDLIRRGDLMPDELETLLTVVVVDATFHGAIDGALAALEDRADEGEQACWEALNAIERLLNDVLIRPSDLREKVSQSRSNLVRIAGLAS